METELKLKVSPANVAALRKHKLFKSLALDSPTKHDLHDTYYDTPKLDLWHNGLTLRVREEAGCWTQTIKTAAEGYPALHERGEWEIELPSIEPDRKELKRRLKAKKMAALLNDPDILDKLHPVFTNIVLRTTWNLKLPSGLVVACSLDTGALHAGGSNIPIGELEFEIKRGNPTELFELALALHQEVALEIANDSKAARGYSMLETIAPKPFEALPVHLTKKMHLEEAFQCMGLNCLQQLEANVPGVLKKCAESLHQMRVGLRRLRSLLDIFSKLAPLPISTHESIDWLTVALGTARDWDVLTNSTLPAIHGEDLGALVKFAGERAQSLHQNLVVTLRDRRYTELLLHLNCWFFGRKWRKDSKLPTNSMLASRAKTAMVPFLKKGQRRLRKRILALKKPDEAARHRVRIAAKKARYSAEFFKYLIPRKPVEQYIQTLSELQDKLGHLNDLSVGLHLLAELEQENSSNDITYALGYLRGTSEIEKSRLNCALHAVARSRIKWA